MLKTERLILRNGPRRMRTAYLNMQVIQMWDRLLAGSRIKAWKKVKL